MFPLGSLIPAFFLDQLGRRRPMMVLSFILACCMAGVAALLSFKGTSVEKSTASASIVFFFLYMFFFGAGPNCIPWVYGKSYHFNSRMRIETIFTYSAGNSSPACPGQGHCHCDLVELDLELHDCHDYANYPESPSTCI